MLEGMYTAAAGMAAQQQRMDAVANDLANVSTTGYKPVRVAFRDLVYANGTIGSDKSVLIGAGAAATAIGRSTKQGDLTETGDPLDVAISGEGFIAVKDPNGKPALTRDGHLRIDDQGRMTTESGLLLDPTIQLPKGTVPDQVKIAADGTVNVAGKKVAAIKLLTVPSPANLQGGADNTFSVTTASGAATAAPKTTTLTQGSLEASGVDTATAMTDLIDAQRSFELASRAITMQDQMLEIANQVKR